MEKQSLTTLSLIPSQALSNSYFRKTPSPVIAVCDIVWDGISPSSIWVSSLTYVTF